MHASFSPCLVLKHSRAMRGLQAQPIWQTYPYQIIRVNQGVLLFLVVPWFHYVLLGLEGQRDPTITNNTNLVWHINNNTRYLDTQPDRQRNRQTLVLSPSTKSSGIKSWQTVIIWYCWWVCRCAGLTNFSLHNLKPIIILCSAMWYIPPPRNILHSIMCAYNI